MLYDSLKIGLRFAIPFPRFIRYLYRNLLLRKKTTLRQLKRFYRKNLVNIFNDYTWTAWVISFITLDTGRASDILSVIVFPFPVLLYLCWLADRNIFKELERFKFKS